MGAWGPGPFDNDSALDFLADVLNGEGSWESVTGILTAIAEADDDAYVDVDDASGALVAAELVAARHGKPLEYTPDEVLDWLKALGSPATLEHRLIAVAAVRRVLENSELQELWEAGPDSEWTKAGEDIITRLDVGDS